MHMQVTTDASVGAMASFLYALEVGERDFPELKRDQRWVEGCCRWMYVMSCCWPGDGRDRPS